MEFKKVLTVLAGAAISTTALAAEPVSRDEVRAMVADMMADAQTRTSLLQGGGMAGYDRGFVVGSANGDYLLRLNGLMQYRYIFSVRDEDDIDPASSNEDDFNHGAQLRKVFLTASGNLVNPNLTYNFRFITGSSSSTSDSSSSWGIDDAWIGYNYGGGWKVRGGQFKLPFLKEELNSDSSTLSAERGIVNGGFSQGRSKGFELQYEQDEWRFMGAYSQGFNTAGTDFDNSEDKGEYAFTARGEWKFAGTWDALKDYTSKAGDADSGYLGAAIHWQEATNAPGNNDDRFFGYTVDAQYEGNGFSIFGAFVGTDNDTENGNFSDYGLTVQAAYRWDEAPEIFARFDGLFLEADRNGNGADELTGDSSNFITVGFNNYYAGNAAKFTLDVIYALDDSDLIPGDSDRLNTLVPGGNDPINRNQGLLGMTGSGEFAVRAQWQLMF